MVDSVVSDPGQWRDVSNEQLKKVQHLVADASVLEDVHGGVERVAGVDQAFPENEVLSCVVSMESGSEVERSSASTGVPMPYVPGLLAFREMPSALDAVKGLGEGPDALLVDGSGAIHPRLAGFATHLGVALDVPAAGVTKNLLCGETEDPVEVGETNPVIYEGDVVGYSFLSKVRCNPIYVSPGHRFSPEGALELVREWLMGHKLPEPIFLADKCVGELRRNPRQESLG